MARRGPLDALLSPIACTARPTTAAVPAALLRCCFGSMRRKNAGVLGMLMTMRCWRELLLPTSSHNVYPHLGHATHN